MAVSGGLTNSCEKKRSEKQRRKGKRYPLNAEFQRIARRDKKAFLSDQCKEIEENNRMGKTRDLFKKMRDTNSWLGESPWRRDSLPTPVFLVFPHGSTGKESAIVMGDLSSIPGLGTFPEEGNSNPL